MKITPITLMIMNPTTTLHLAVRVLPNNENHHLWNNNGSWWFHFTLRNATGYSKRVRRSLKTSDIGKARVSRDRILNALHDASGHIAA